ncbi:MAG: hypothetical protein ICV87_07875 [Gemmatimonadetes bacterium]|nr:hypothetical protein [Gemmatimonadota bacterium]
MEPRTIHLNDRRVLAANANDLVGHGVAAFGVLGAVSGSFPPRTAGETVLAAAQVAAGVALLAAIAREVWEIRSGFDRDHGISWVNLFAAAVLTAGLVQRYQTTGRFSRPAALTALLAAVLAFLGPRIKRRQAERRSLRLDDDGILFRLGPFRRFAARWTEIAALHRDGATLRVELRDGRTRALRLRLVTNRDEVFAAVSEHASARGIPAAPANPLASGRG